jgi:hypothetical protein
MCDKPYTSDDKWTAALLSGLLFLIVASPYTYSFTNGVAKAAGFDISDVAGCPNAAGLIAHGIIFALLLRLIMNKSNERCEKPYTSKDKWIISIIGGLLFILLSSPFLYTAVNSVLHPLGLKTADGAGCPNIAGLLVHTAVFTLLTRVLMR